MRARPYLCTRTEDVPEKRLGCGEPYSESRGRLRSGMNTERAGSGQPMVNHSPLR